MAARVTATDVKAIIPDCTLADATIDVFIAAATLVIDDVFANDTTTSDDMLKEIERWYSAHLVVSTSWRQSAREKVGDAEVEYGSKVEYVGKGYDLLKSTPYGAVALQLDTTGKMNRLGKRAAILLAIESFD